MSTNNPETSTQTLDAVVLPLTQGALTSGSSPRLYLGWRIALTIFFFILLILLGLLFGVYSNAEAAANLAPPAQSSSDRLVLAFYYSWFDENTWTYDKLSDLPASPYVSRDRGVMGRHIDEAKRAGIDALVVAWYGPNGDSNQTEPNLAAMLDEAAARNFKIAILFETDSPFLGSSGAVTGALQHALSVHANHPAYLRVDGRPVIFFWRPHMYGVDTWRDMRAQVDPSFGSIWISEGVDTSYLSVFDGHHLYSNTWNPPADLSGVNAKFANQVQGVRQQTGAAKFWVATVMPGYNDVRIRPGGGFAADREGGAYFERAWQAAIASQPNWIVINSFNEWPEGSYIEPSAAYGDLFLNLAAKWSGQFKGDGSFAAASMQALPQPLTPAVAAAPVANSAPAPEPGAPTAYVDVVLLNIRAEPNTTAPILAQFAQGAALAIVSKQAEWWQVALNDQTGWAYGPMVRVANVEANPTENSTSFKAATVVTPSTLNQAPNITPSTGINAARAVDLIGKSAVVSAPLLNMRSGPNLETDVVALLPRDTQLTITGATLAAPEWILVSDGRSNGWVYRSMINMVQ
ncbi:MAG: endo-1,3-alpha-glucanase family glycosylhydrolase [Caldilineaceae bacterium]